MAHLQLSLQATKEDRSGRSCYSNIASVVSSCWDFWQRMRRKRCWCLFYCFSGIIDREVIVFAGLSPPRWMHLRFETGRTVHCERPLLTQQPVGRWAEMKQLQRRKQQSSGCVSGPQRVRAETDEGVEGSYSLLKAPHKSKWLTWRTHDAGISHTRGCTWIHKYSCVRTQTRLFFICHTRICVCAHSCKTKLAVSYSQAVETDLPQCLHCLMRGEGYRKRCSTVQRGDLPSMENQWRKISTHTDVAVEQVHLLHACCSNAEQLHNPKRNCWRRDSSSDRGEGMQGLREAIYKNSFCFIPHVCPQIKNNAQWCKLLYSYTSRRARTELRPETWKCCRSPASARLAYLISCFFSKFCTQFMPSKSHSNI